MSKERADLGFADEIDSFDPEEWTPSPKKPLKPKPEPEVTRKVATEAGFQSREPAAEEPKRPQRRRRTGRNVQFNIKAKPETIDAFCAVADGQGWGLGETLEYAVELLEARYGSQSEEASKAD